MHKNEKVDYFFITINMYDISFSASPIVLFYEVAQETEALKPITELTERGSAIMVKNAAKKPH
jgi:hypothetical protein